ncbi:MAG TPA: MMPL family transporter [Gammaproteobacteria bacterium]|nr:MMPL family transporter [Gammaproteobacteria bacterium]
MRRAVARTLDLVEGHPRRVLLLFALTGLFALGGGGFRIGHSYEDWIDRDDPSWRDYQAMKAAFGDADTVLAAFPRALLTPKNLERYYDLIDALRARDGVLDLFEPAELLLGADATTPPLSANVEDLRQSFARTAPDWRNVLVSRDADWLCLLLLLDPAQRDAQAATLAALRAGLAALGATPRYAGTALFGETLKQAIAGDLRRVACLLLAASAALLLWFFRSPQAAFAVFAGLALSVLYALALCGLIGLSVNLLTLLLVPLVFCVSLTTAIHLFARRDDGAWRLRSAWPQVLRPLAIATTTTALGCLAFANAPQAIVARMGFAMPAAVACTFLTSMLFVPALLAACGDLAQVPAVKLPRAIPSHVWRRRVSVVLVVLALAAAASLPRLEREPDALRFFADDAPLVRDYRDIEARFSGLLVADLVIRARAGRIDAPPARAAIERFLVSLREIPEMTNVVAGYELLQVASAAADSPLGSAFFDAGRTATRISLRLRNVAADDRARRWPALADDIRKRWAAVATPDLSLTVTGLIPLILEAQDRLLHVQALTLLAGLVVACLLLWPFFRTPSLVALAALATFMPLLVTAGAMVWLEIPLNAINLFVGSVILGLVVDDAIYLLHALRERGDVELALAEVGPALGITSLSVGLAFATLTACELVPIRQFGLLAAIAVATAWASDTCLLPTLIAWRRVRAAVAP